MRILTPFVFASIFILASCGGKTASIIQNTSANGQTKITIEAKRPMPFEPWQVDMKVKAYTFKEGSLKFEISAETIDSTNVTFNWEDETNCKITFIQKDNTERHFHLIASPEQVQMAEI